MRVEAVAESDASGDERAEVRVSAVVVDAADRAEDGAAEPIAHPRRVSAPLGFDAHDGISGRAAGRESAANATEAGGFELRKDVTIETGKYLPGKHGARGQAPIAAEFSARAVVAIRLRSVIGD